MIRRLIGRVLCRLGRHDWREEWSLYLPQRGKVGTRCSSCGMVVSR